MDDIGLDVQAALLEHARRQTEALEALRNFALIVLAMSALGLVLLFVALF